MRRVIKLPLRSKLLLFRRGNYSCKRIIPLVERGPFRTFLLSWQWGQIEYSLKRWN